MRVNLNTAKNYYSEFNTKVFIPLRKVRTSEGEQVNTIDC